MSPFLDCEGEDANEGNTRRTIGTWCRRLPFHRVTGGAPNAQCLAVRIGRGFDETNGRTAERRLALHSAERLGRRARGCAAKVAVALMRRLRQVSRLYDAHD